MYKYSQYQCSAHVSCKVLIVLSGNDEISDDDIYKMSNFIPTQSYRISEDQYFNEFNNTKSQSVILEMSVFAKIF